MNVMANILRYITTHIGELTESIFIGGNRYTNNIIENVSANAIADTHRIHSIIISIIKHITRNTRYVNNALDNSILFYTNRLFR